MTDSDLNERIDELLLHLQRTAAELSIYKGLTYKQVSQRRKYQRTRAKAAISQLITEEVEKVLDEIDNELDDIKGAANKSYYPYMDDESRFSHIASAVDELRGKLKQRNKSKEVV